MIGYGGTGCCVLEIVAISPILLVAWQAHSFVSDTSHVFTSLEHYLPAVNGLLFNIVLSYCCIYVV